jgi:molecular chaperone GrpE (heat shock protein)
MTDPTPAEPRIPVHLPAAAEPAGAVAAGDWPTRLAAAEARAEQQREALPAHRRRDSRTCRRRSAREVEARGSSAPSAWPADLLPVVDGLELGLKAATAPTPRR